MKVTESCPVLFGPTDYTVPGIFQAGIVERVASPSGVLPDPGRSQATSIAGGFVTS